MHFAAFAAAGMFEAKALKPLQVRASASLGLVVHRHLPELREHSVDTT